MKALVVSNKMDNALVVTVTSSTFDKKYKKAGKVVKRYKVSTGTKQSSDFYIGQTVDIKSCRPVSKHISWVVS